MVRPLIPINKGNYPLEAPEREESFHKKLGSGWEKEYYAYRKLWVELPQKQLVADYPLLADLELSTACNLKCRMCYTITQEFKESVHSQFMDYRLFTEIIDEICDKVSAVRLSLRGEPTLHPRFIDCIAYAKQKGVREISFLTNGSRLTKAFFKEIMDAGADWITISVDGINDMYETIRKPLKFSETLRKIKDIKALKIARKRTKPVIKIQAVWPAISADPEQFYSIFAPFVDLIAFNPLIDYLHKDDDGSILYEENFLCPQHYQRIVITSDGLALMCSNDEKGSVEVGDAKEETIYEIWHGQRLAEIRNIHKQKNGFMSMKVCRKCYLPRRTHEMGKRCVNGRRFSLKNYINRRQVIGE